LAKQVFENGCAVGASNIVILDPHTGEALCGACTNIEDIGEDMVDPRSQLNEASVEACVEKEPTALDPLLVQVAKANIAPAPKKKKIEVESEEATQKQ